MARATYTSYLSRSRNAISLTLGSEGATICFTKATSFAKAFRAPNTTTSASPKGSHGSVNKFGGFLRTGAAPGAAAGPGSKVKSGGYA